MAHPPQALPAPRRMRPETSAWLMLIAFFCVFCVLVAGAGTGGWFYYSNAMAILPQAMVIVHAPSGVSTQENEASSLTIPQTPCADSDEVCTSMTEGTRVVANPEAGYGQVASLVLADQSQIDLWAHPTGADLRLEQYRASRWTNGEQIVQFQQNKGYARYDIRAGQRYAKVHYVVNIANNIQIELAVPGSYSINIPSPIEQTSMVSLTSGLRANMALVEVATRSGGATLHSGPLQRQVEPNSKRQVLASGAITEQMLPSWQLIKDGDFGQYAGQSFYAPGHSNTWQRFWTPTVPDLRTDERNANFNVVQACNPETPVICENNQVNVAQFRRDGNQTRPFFIGLFQPLNIDVSEYKSLQLSAWVRVVSQSLPSVGDGTECPLLIHVQYKETSPSDPDETQYICIYSTQDGNTISKPELHGDIFYKQVPTFDWYYLKNFELRDIAALKNVRYLRVMRIEARGHDYVSEFTNVSLVGRQ